jgi:hypothetical protein
MRYAPAPMREIIFVHIVELYNQRPDFRFPFLTRRPISVPPSPNCGEFNNATAGKLNRNETRDT